MRAPTNPMRRSSKARTGSWNSSPDKSPTGPDPAGRAAHSSTSNDIARQLIDGLLPQSQRLLALLRVAQEATGLVGSQRCIHTTQREQLRVRALLDQAAAF